MPSTSGNHSGWFLYSLTGGWIDSQPIELRACPPQSGPCGDVQVRTANWFAPIFIASRRAARSLPLPGSNFGQPFRAKPVRRATYGVYERDAGALMPRIHSR